MQVTVRLFAKARDVAGTNKFKLDFDESDNSLQAAVALLLKKFPALADVLPTCSLALNQEFVVEAKLASTTLKDGDVLAVLPPVSGG
mmetsp:Transcript_43656/g.64034  ORF Transcript_43656/g.64034 Transcript_43656/m.64034 type:complete len:87 (+) Transcript_43656:131-391(+)|eukprot:CAMPEP_0195514594 /NCGR_PEP_ID=MMETSP0794_2-20130614/5927_1 /TAXON_ID=515487 /ORGANISM="Stephanopyxis turris, Strain CCMP 815" /LENGTH=86 /DNA_ID=CAMNT_0040642857 /DNA_START=49 /DNA_END=309 /DNA_ORIENTATION=+